VHAEGQCNKGVCWCCDLMMVVVVVVFKIYFLL
jgi:hypothetical protein